MKRQFRDYHEKLLQDLQDPELVTVYLNEALTDENPRVFLLALKNVCTAQAITDLAKKNKPQNPPLSSRRVWRAISRSLITSFLP
jgi:DNA-binding phage protein